ncbi:MAG: hypothetical protein RRY78_03480 [Clostridia bacterium]
MKNKSKKIISIVLISIMQLMLLITCSLLLRTNITDNQMPIFPEKFVWNANCTKDYTNKDFYQDLTNAQQAISDSKIGSISVADVFVSTNIIENTEPDKKGVTSQVIDKEAFLKYVPNNTIMCIGEVLAQKVTDGRLPKKIDASGNIEIIAGKENANLLNKQVIVKSAIKEGDVYTEFSFPAVVVGVSSGRTVVPYLDYFLNNKSLSNVAKAVYFKKFDIILSAQASLEQINTSINNNGYVRKVDATKQNFEQYNNQFNIISTLMIIATVLILILMQLMLYKIIKGCNIRLLLFIYLFGGIFALLLNLIFFNLITFILSILVCIANTVIFFTSKEIHNA